MNTNEVIAKLKKKCTVVKYHDAGLMGDYTTKEIDYKKLSRLLIQELRQTHHYQKPSK